MVTVVNVHKKIIGLCTQTTVGPHSCFLWNTTNELNNHTHCSVAKRVVSLVSYVNLLFCFDGRNGCACDLSQTHFVTPCSFDAPLTPTTLSLFLLHHLLPFSLFSFSVQCTLLDPTNLFVLHSESLRR
jgi:hypothetical protein